jgi:hypothetical protein
VITNIAENLWLLSYPLKKLGADLRRNVTVVRLGSDELVIHSTAPFSPADITGIRELGRPAWLVEAMLGHDTFAKEGREAFPEIPYLAPSGFSVETGIPTSSIDQPPAAWSPELDVQKVEGVPSYQEYLFFHAPSRTLIVADLVFNFGDNEPLWTEMLLRVAIGGQHHPGMSRPFKAAVKDEAAFQRSMEAMFSWDFDRLIPGHGDVIETGAKEQVRNALKAAGF